MKYSLSVEVAIVVLLVCGCGQQGPARFDVSGTVTYDGQPLPQGTIRFEPDGSKGNHGPVGYAAITDGTYTTKGQGTLGAIEGPLVVWITGLPAVDPTAEFQLPLFTDFRAEIDISPAGGRYKSFDFTVPAKRSRR